VLGRLLSGCATRGALRFEGTAGLFCCSAPAVSFFMVAASENLLNAPLFCGSPALRDKKAARCQNALIQAATPSLPKSFLNGAPIH